jgi:hypothetical protein
MWHIWIRRDMCKGFLLGNLEERDHLKDTDEERKIKIKSSSNRMGGCSLG